MNDAPYRGSGFNAQEIPRWPPFVDEEGEPLPWAELTPEQQAECHQRKRLQWQARARIRWGQAVAVEGTRAAAYLSLIGASAPYSAALRYHPTLFCTSLGHVLPALLCAVTPIDAPSQIEAIKPIWLDPHSAGTLRTGMMGLVGHSSGGVVVLDELAEEIVITRRIDSAIAAGAVLGLPAVATVSARWVARPLTLPPFVRRVIVARSSTGRTTALEAWADLQRAKGVEVELRTPPDDLEHWTDAARARL